MVIYEDEIYMYGASKQQYMHSVQKQGEKDRVLLVRNHVSRE